MKHWIRIIIVSLILIGGATLFAFWSVERYQKSLDALIDMCQPVAVSNQPISGRSIAGRCENVCEQRIAAECPAISVAMPVDLEAASSSEEGATEINLEAANAVPAPAATTP